MYCWHQQHLSLINWPQCRWAISNYWPSGLKVRSKIQSPIYSRDYVYLNTSLNLLTLVQKNRFRKLYFSAFVLSFNFFSPSYLQSTLSRNAMLSKTIKKHTLSKLANDTLLLRNEIWVPDPDIEALDDVTGFSTGTNTLIYLPSFSEK